MCDLLWHFGGPRYAILESICILYMDVGHYKIISDHLLGSLVLLKLIPYFSATIKSTVFVIYFDTLGVRDMQFRNQSVLSMLM